MLLPATYYELCCLLFRRSDGTEVLQRFPKAVQSGEKYPSISGRVYSWAGFRMRAIPILRHTPNVFLVLPGAANRLLTRAAQR